MIKHIGTAYDALLNNKECYELTSQAQPTCQATAIGSLNVWLTT